MAAERYAGSAGAARLREDEEKNTGRARIDADAARRDLLIRLPAGRALDMEDLVTMCDEGTQTSRAIIMRQRLLALVRGQVPAGVLVNSHDVEQIRAHSEAHPTQPGPCPGIPEWPAGRQL